MLYKDDWYKSQERFDAFWNGEIIDRCCFAVKSPRNNSMDSSIKFREFKNLEEKWLDSEFRYNNFMYDVVNTFYGADAFPNFWPNLGPGVTASFVGSPYNLDEGTIWFDTKPIITDWDNHPEINLFQESPMWINAYTMMEYFLKRADGNYFVSMTDLGGTLDIIASLRGSETLLFDFYDYPDEVLNLINKIDNIWIESYEKLQRLSEKYILGSGGWLPLWCRERCYPIQCDICVMISPQQFEKFAMPSLIRQSQYLGKCIYHLDGPGELKHLDQILSIDRIDAIEWVPVPEDGRWTIGDEKWYLLYKKIQEKGKKLILRDVEPASIEKLLDSISPKGLFFTTYAQNEDEAKDIIKKVEKWSLK